jgi:hypothetical protein
MKFPTNPFKDFSLFELFLLTIFIIYLVFPIKMPNFMNKTIESPLGMVSIFIVTLALFVYASPILAILYIFVAYELLRRSSQKINNYKNSSNDSSNLVSIPDFTSIEKNEPAKPEVLLKNNVLDLKTTDVNESQNLKFKVGDTLEEEVVEYMAPIGKSDSSVYVQTSYQPIIGKESDISAAAYN